MFGVTRHLRVGTVFVLLLLLTFLPLKAGAADTAIDPHAVSESPSVIITEIQTNGGVAAREFIELYNTTDEPISLSTVAGAGSQWKLQFYGSSVLKDGSPAWQTAPTPYVFSLKGTIQPHGYLLIASTDHSQLGVALPAEQVYTKSNPMTDSGGALELVEVPAAQTASQAIVHDQVFWLDASQTPGVDVMPTPAKSGSLQREPNGEAEYLNDDGTLQGFVSDSSITPLAPWVPPVIPPDEPAENEESPSQGENEGVVSTENNGLLPPYLTELLPNPVSPLKDETDEYIELFNPNADPFNLRGYTLEVGTTTLREFTLTEDLMIAPESYLVLYARDTRLTLANSAGQARLLSPQGDVLSESLPYSEADEGAVWAFANETWQWSASATPGAINVITMLPTTTKATSATTKKAATKTAATKVKGTTKTKKAAAAKKVKKAKKPKVATVAQTTVKPPRAPIHSGVLVAVVGVAVLYAAYEYRHDLSNRIHKLRGHRRIRAVAR